MARGHYTFKTFLSIEADSEQEAHEELGRRLARLQEGEFVTGYGIDTLARDLTYDDAGNLRSPA